MADKPSWAELVAQALPDLAVSDQPLLIAGEVGSGRATLATRIHQASGRSGPCLIVFCAEATAGTLAARHAAAARGSLCLRDLELLPPDAQAELLRLLATPGTVRIIATAAPVAADCVAQGRLRSDLWQRVQGQRLDVPPLRERMEEIPALAEAMLGPAAGRLTAEARAALLSYRWPLNLRELHDGLRQALAAAGRGRAIGLQHLPPAVTQAYREARGEGVYARFQEAVEKTLLLWCLESARTRAEAAKALGISRAGLYKQLHRHGILDDPAMP